MVPESYYVALSAILFSIGVVGVVIRRNPLVIFMSIELMLNASNLALVPTVRGRAEPRRGRCRAGDHRDDLSRPPAAVGGRAERDALVAGRNHGQDTDAE